MHVVGNQMYHTPTHPVLDIMPHGAGHVGGHHGGGGFHHGGGGFHHHHHHHHRFGGYGYAYGGPYYRYG